MTVREILEDYKKKIHGSEYDYHKKVATIEQHNQYMQIAQDQALSSLAEEVGRLEGQEGTDWVLKSDVLKMMRGG